MPVRNSLSAERKQGCEALKAVEPAALSLACRCTQMLKNEPRCFHALPRLELVGPAQLQARRETSQDERPRTSDDVEAMR